MSVTIKRGDTAQIFTDTLKVNGEPIDLTGASVKFIMKRSGLSPVQGSATIINATRGKVSYTPTAGDVGTAGTMDCEWEITFSDSTILTVPNDKNISITIMTDLNPT